MSHVDKKSNYFSSQHPPKTVVLSTWDIVKKTSFCAMLCTDPSGTFLSHPKAFSAQVRASVTHSFQENRIFTSLDVYSLGWKTGANKIQVTLSHPACIVMPWAPTRRALFLCSLAEFPQKTIQCDHDRALATCLGLCLQQHTGAMQSQQIPGSFLQVLRVLQCIKAEISLRGSSPVWPQCEWHREESSSPPACAAVAAVSGSGRWD